MGKKTAVPDAWDDDWETLADQAEEEEHEQERHEQPAPTPKLSKAERLARHAEENRKIWESAETTPETFHFLEANSRVPASAGYQKPVQLLSRKPQIARRNPATGLSELCIDDDDDQEAVSKAPRLSPEEIRQKQARDQQEKMRKYEEARARIFGDSAGDKSEPASRSATPPGSSSGQKGRGGGRGRGRGSHKMTEPRAPADPEGGRPRAAKDELYDPNYSPKPGFTIQKRDETAAELQPVRVPRGPEGQGRGFAPRGGRGGG